MKMKTKIAPHSSMYQQIQCMQTQIKNAYLDTYLYTYINIYLHIHARTEERGLFLRQIDTRHCHHSILEEDSASIRYSITRSRED